jgi:lipid A ethanolaminephosphotransferase
MTLFQTLRLQSDVLRDAGAITPVMLTALTTAFVFCIDNGTFWSVASDVFSGHALSFAGYMLAVFSLTLALFSLFAFPWSVKPFLIFIVILSAVTSYYVDQLGVIIDRDMIQNVMVTTLAESRHLITPDFVIHVLVRGILPALVIAWVRIRRHGRIRTALVPVLTCVTSLALAAGLLMADLKSYSSILRERKDFMSSYQPGAPVVGAIRYAKMMSRTANVVVTRIGTDATRGASYAAKGKPLLTIVVAGETARAQNFSLNGYGVDTNPELAKRPVVNFGNVSSCGTATAVSLPCMFSKYTRADYSYEKGIATENVLDVIRHAGLNVVWWDNNTGDKGIGKRIATRSFTDAQDPQYCDAGECMDGVFMDALETFADTITQDTVLVLHQMGSHGPTYYLRYPPEFERFKPACNTAEFKSCTPQEITNAYDNTIAYTDHILARTIDLLAAQDRLSTALLYVSDHGESLGESGLYLHGSPYFMAPEYQTQVPMILWMSGSFKDRFGIDQTCLAGQTDKALSHDNLFHSLLGMLDIRTVERNDDLNIFASCKTKQKVAANEG